MYGCGNKQIPNIAKRCRSVFGCAVLLGLAFTAVADNITWTNAAGGDFQTPGNWDAQSVPGASDVAIFNLTTQPYAVTWSTNSTIGAFKINAGTVLWNLNGYTNNFSRPTDSTIGTTTVAAHLTVTNGVVKNTTTGYSSALLFKMKGSGSTLRVESRARMDGMIYPQIATGTKLTVDGTGAYFGSSGYWYQHAGTLIVTNGGSINASSGLSPIAGGRVHMTGTGYRGAITIKTFATTASMRFDRGATVSCGVLSDVMTISGKLTLQDGLYYYYSPTSPSAGYVSLNGSSAILEGLGALEFTSVTNHSGVVRPGGQVGAGRLSIWRRFTNGAGGRIEIELGGTNTNDHDRLLVPYGPNGPGTFHAGGTLNVSLINGFNPVRKDTFDIFDFVSMAGTFDAINLPDDGKGWDISDLYTTGVLRYIGLPGGTLLSIR